MQLCTLIVHGRSFLRGDELLRVVLVELGRIRVENQGRVEVREFCWRQEADDSARLVRCSSCAYATLVPILRRGLPCLVAAVGVLARQLANAPVRGGFYYSLVLSVALGKPQ